MPGASIGAYYKNFNAQLDCYFGEESYDDDWSDEELVHRVDYIGLRLGYGVKLASCIRLTPQLGCGYAHFRGCGDGYGCWDGGEGVYATLALRAEYGILPWLSVTLTPEYSYPLTDGYGWGDDMGCDYSGMVKDFRINLGVAFGF